MMTLSGKLLTLDNNEAPDIHDIAVGLSRTNRFGGQTLVPWNDAQHSLVCQRIAKKGGLGKRMQIIMLLHDAHEMMTGDACRPFKPKGMSDLQHALDARIYRSLGVEQPRRWEKGIQDYIDNSALVAEAMIVTPEATYLQACKDCNLTPFASDVDIVSDVLEIEAPEVEYEAELRTLLSTESWNNAH